MALYVDIHVLQTLPPSNPNRDDTGAPKSASYGGVRRMRISSQAVKRATRKDFEAHLPEGNRGIRTKLIVELLAEEITTRDPELSEKAVDLAEKALTEIGFNLKKSRGNKAKNKTQIQPKEAEFLVFISAKQLEHLAEAVISVAGADDFKKSSKI